MSYKDFNRIYLTGGYDISWCDEQISDDDVEYVNARIYNEAIEALESTEWVGGQGSSGQFCPFCRGLYPDHRSDCKRQSAIAKARGESE